MKTKVSANFSVLLQAFFTDYLIFQCHVSEHTIASYRDTFRLLLKYTQENLKKAPSELTLDDVDASLIRDFLKELETARNISARSRNQRLAAIRSCFRYAALHFPEQSDSIKQILAIPQKRHKRASIDFLTTDEIDALLEAPNRATRTGRRDYTMFLLAVRTGLRVSELTAIHKSDVACGSGAHVRCFGKGRKERATPLTKTTASVLKAWIEECKLNDGDLIFTSARGQRLSTDGVQYLLNKHVVVASKHCPSLTKKRVTPHVLRHAAAMQLLQSGVDSMIIALWLGHESVESTRPYVEADLKMKEKALERTTEPKNQSIRYVPDDELLAFLNAL